MKHVMDSFLTKPHTHKTNAANTESGLTTSGGLRIPFVVGIVHWIMPEYIKISNRFALHWI